MSVKRNMLMNRLARISLRNQPQVQTSSPQHQSKEFNRVRIIQVKESPLHFYQQQKASIYTSETPNTLNINSQQQDCLRNCHFRSRTISNDLCEIQEDKFNCQTSSCKASSDTNFTTIIPHKRQSHYVQDEAMKDVNTIKNIPFELLNPMQIARDELLFRIRNKKLQFQQIKNNYIKKPERKDFNQFIKHSLPKIELAADKQSDSSRINGPQSNEDKSSQKQQIIIVNLVKQKQTQRITSSKPTIIHKNHKKEEKYLKLTKIRQIQKQYCKPFSPPSDLTAKSYIIYQVTERSKTIIESEKILLSFCSKISQQMASLTKIMTCILIIQFCQKQQIDMDKEQVIVGKYQSGIKGTTANLKEWQIYNIRQLLYGLMLPSGNDASLALAVWCGRQILSNWASGLDIKLKAGLNVRSQYVNPNQLDNINDSSISCVSTKNSLNFSKGKCYRRFIAEMNRKAQQLSMLKTRYSNSHGLSNSNNISTAYDIALLCQYAMNNQIFRQIVGCKHYTTTIKFIDQSQINQNPEQLELIDTKTNLQINNDTKSIINDASSSTQKYIQSNQQLLSLQSNKIKIDKSPYPIQQISITWSNTHKHVHSRSQYLGIKTGYTTSAGSCLSSYIRIDDRCFIIIVLGCSKLSMRFKQTQTLKRWLCKHEGIGMKLSKNQSSKGKYAKIQQELTLKQQLQPNQQDQFDQY